MKRPSPPRLAEWLLARLVPLANRTFILGDLAEQYRATIHPARGGVGARLWYWGQVVSALVSHRRLAAAGASPRWRVLWSETRQDLRYAVRTFRRQPLTAAAVVITLALGMGANTAMFRVVNRVLLQPLPFADADALLSVQRIRPNGLVGELGYPDLEAIRGSGDAMQSIAGYTSSMQDLAGVSEPVRIEVAVVTGRFFDVVQWRPMLGRLLRQSDDTNRERSVVLTHGMWRRRFGSDAGILGRTIRIGDRPYTVVGVLDVATPPFPSGAVEAFIPPRENFNHGAFWLSGIARLGPGASLAAAQAQLAVADRRLTAERPDIYTDRHFTVQSLHAALVGDKRPLLLIFFAAVSLVLLAACANVVNVNLIRTTARRREFAVRTALGGTRWRLRRQLLTEAVGLAVLGGILGLAAAQWTGNLLRALRPSGIPEAAGWWQPMVLVFVIGLSLAIGVLLGWASGRILVQEPGRGSLLTYRGASHRQQLGRNTLVVAQIAAALVLVVGSGLLLKSLHTLSAVDPGFSVERIIWFRVSLPASSFGNRAAISEFHDAVRSRLAAVPGVDRVASVSLNPFNGGNLCNTVRLASDPDAELPCAEFRSATPGYFETIGVPLLRGRDFTPEDRDGAPPVAIVNERFARQVWPNEDAIGQRFTMWSSHPNTEVIGVVGDARQFGLDREAAPEVFMPQEQFPFRYARYAVRTVGPSTAIIPALRAAVWEVNANVPISELSTMQQLVDASKGDSRFRALALTAMALLAFAVAVVGVGSVVAFTVTERLPEIGIRVALGAGRSRVVREVTRTGLRLVGVGVAIGVLAGLVGARVLQRFLFGVGTADPAVFVAAGAIVVGSAAVACYLPALRASKVDPVETLRRE